VGIQALNVAKETSVFQKNLEKETKEQDLSEKHHSKQYAGSPHSAKETSEFHKTPGKETCKAVYQRTLTYIEETGIYQRRDR